MKILSSDLQFCVPADFSSSPFLLPFDEKTAILITREVDQISIINIIVRNANLPHGEREDNDGEEENAGTDTVDEWRGKVALHPIRVQSQEDRRQTHQISKKK